jgi:hypothetical protein
MLDQIDANRVLSRIFLTASRNDGSAGLTATLRDTYDNSVVITASARNASFPIVDVHVLSLAADEGFIHPNLASRLFKTAILHGNADAVIHESC